jgi:hypothetical protein
MPSVQVFAPLGEIISHTIPFRNPFNFPLPVDIILTPTDPEADQDQDQSRSNRPKDIENNRDNRVQEKEEGAFSLLLRRFSNIVIPPKGMFQVGISFAPARLGSHGAAVQIRSAISGRSLLWCIPLSGVADSAGAEIVAKLVTRCKSSLLQDINIPLSGLRRADIRRSDPILSDFSLETIIETKHKGQLDRALRVLPLELIEIPDEKNNMEKLSTNFILKYRALFEPLKTLTGASVELVVTCKDRGRWRVIIELESTEPEPDDYMRMIAAVGSSDKMSFRLSNRFLGLTNFQAYFTAKSSSHFSVSPSSGVLAPFGVEGTLFVVSFTPLVYGNRETASLIVSTDDVQWNYELVGTYPDHVGVTVTSSKKKAIGDRR